MGTQQLLQITLPKPLQDSVLAIVTISASKSRHAFCLVGPWSPCNAWSLCSGQDAILHCLWGAGLLAGLQNPADPPWELQVTPPLQKAEQTRGILFHVNKILKYKVEIPSISEQSEGKDLTHWCCSCKREWHTAHCAAPSWGNSAPSKEKGLVPLCQVCPYSWMSRNEIAMCDSA